MVPGHLAWSPVLIARAIVAAVALVWGCGSDQRSPGAPSPSPAPSALKHVLVVTHTAGFRHSSIAIGESTMASLAAQSGRFDVVNARTEDDVRRLVTAEGLMPFDAVAFLNTTGDLGIPNVAVFLEWLRAGHGFFGAHSASDTYHNEAGYLDMLGGEFNRHGDQTTVDLRVENSSHASVSHLGSTFRILDEIYKFSGNDRGQVNVLLSLDRHPNDGLPEQGQAGDLLLAWFKPYGNGRVFYTALGHREEVWQDARYRQHVRGGLEWVLGF